MPSDITFATDQDLVKSQFYPTLNSVGHTSVQRGRARDPALIDLTSRLSRRLTVKRPIVSANMDTVTRSEMAIAVAEEGGIGIIDRGFRSGEIEPQVREVQIVKRKQHQASSATPTPSTKAPHCRTRPRGCEIRASERSWWWMASGM